MRSGIPQALHFNHAFRRCARVAHPWPQGT